MVVYYHRMRSMHRVLRVLAAGCAIAWLLVPAAAQRLDLGAPREVAPGILLYHVTDPALVMPEAPMSIWLLRLDPARVRLQSALGNDEIMGTETVAGIAARHSAAAAINAGFFLSNGDPAGVLAIDGQLVSDARRARGAVGIMPSSPGPRLIFARLRATVAVTIGRHGDRVPVDGVDTTRMRGRLMLFTPAYHPDTDTAPGGLEWTLDGSPLRVAGTVRTTGKTPIPRHGFVLSYGGTTPPPSLRSLRRGVRVSLTTEYDPLEGSEDWGRAQHIIGGAGLLLWGGAVIDDWSVEQFAPGFAENRHPRTMIGTRSDGTIWLVTVDGRQPQLSAGMTLLELRALAERLDLVNALNLDGGGSTTMWVAGEIVNSPSDATGPRQVSDALLVYPTTPGAGEPDAAPASAPRIEATP